MIHPINSSIHTVIYFLPLCSGLEIWKGNRGSILAHSQVGRQTHKQTTTAQRSIKVGNLTKCSDGVAKVGNWGQGSRGDPFHEGFRIPAAI